MLRQFREHCGRDIPIVVVSSSYAPADVARAYELGAQHFFHKPSDLDEFLKFGALVRELVEKNPTPRI
jgi:CheY-like chemotaxis protein